MKTKKKLNHLRLRNMDQMQFRKRRKHARY